MKHTQQGWTRGMACAAVAALAVGGAMGRPPPDPAIAYLTPGSISSLSVMNADGSNVATIHSGTGFIIQLPSWSPDGGSIAFAAMASSGRISLQRIDVAVIDGVPRGINHAVVLADPLTSYSYPAWSPLGDEIAFADINSGALMTIPAAGGAPQTLLAPPAGRVYRWPAWSPDGAFVAFYEFIGSELGSITVLERATGLTTTILGPQVMPLHSLDWARTQDTLAMHVGFGGVYGPGTYLLPVAPGAAPQLIRPNSSGGSWAPDDSALVISEPKNPTKKVNTSNPVMLKRLNPATGATVTLVPGQRPVWRR